MTERRSSTGTGGVIISGSIGSIGGDLVGGNKTSVHLARSLDSLFGPVAEAITQAPPEFRVAAETTLRSIKDEAGKGSQANDGLLAKLLDQLINLIPQAAAAITSAFADPILAQISGPVTKFVLDKLR